MRRSVKTVRLLLLLLVFSFFWTAAPGAAVAEDRLDRLEQEVQELKKENSEIKKRMGEVETDGEETRHSLGLISKLVDVSGYADAEYILTGQPGESNHFRIRHLSLFFTKDIQKEWKLFTEIEFEDAPKIVSNPASDTVSRSQGTVFVEQMYVEYHPSTSWDLRAGRYLTPAGIWSIYHYPPYVPTQTSPMLYKVIFPEVSDGLLLRKSFSVFDSALDTHLFVANGSGNSGAGDRNQNKAVGARVNLGVISGLSFGASFYGEKDNQDIRRSSYGTHLLYGRGPFLLQSEFAIRHNNTSGGINDRSFYAQLSYDIKSWGLAARADWYDANDKVSRDAHYRYTGALNYHFAHNVVGKLEFDRNLFDDPAIKNYNEVIMAIVVAIGDL